MVGVGNLRSKGTRAVGHAWTLDVLPFLGLRPWFLWAISRKREDIQEPGKRKPEGLGTRPSYRQEAQLVAAGVPKEPG